MANGIVYVGSADGKVSALNATTGATVWTVTTGGGVQSSPAVANGIVYVGSDGRQGLRAERHDGGDGLGRLTYQASPPWIVAGSANGISLLRPPPFVAGGGQTGIV